jgi:hypothetical protein
MSDRIFLKRLFSVALILVLFWAACGFGQGNRDQAFARVKEVQAMHGRSLMARAGVVGTAIGNDDEGNPILLILTEMPGMAGLPADIDGVTAEPYVTGKLYANKPPSVKPGKPPKDTDTDPPAAPTGLVAEAFGTTVWLEWDQNTETDLEHYNVYRSVDGISFSLVASTAETYHLDEGLQEDKTYLYYITAEDNSGNISDPSNPPVEATTGESLPPLWEPRPVPIGVSIGHPQVTAGTLGCRVLKNGVPYILSNNHVMANSDMAIFGDPILQPGDFDGGIVDRDEIGSLTDWVEINFDGSANMVDAAIAECIKDDEIGVLVHNATAIGYGTPNSQTTEAYIGMPVQKVGRTTGHTTGKVTAIYATAQVTYDAGVAVFENQIIITGIRRRDRFSDGGDSGSLIVTNDEACNPVGLLFAGGTFTTIANPIDDVLAEFGILIDGK